MSNDLRLNSLDRFEKNSERLVLEEHGHCEVPAGCGGVVLRWFNPNSGVPVIFHGGLADRLTIYVDEVQADSGRVIVPYGEHLLAIHAAGMKCEILGEGQAGLSIGREITVCRWVLRRSSILEVVRRT
ncbi:MAG: hypothetical protein GY949_21640 [Gammaproteobacteria bacterium]|nr:hypothetical protein [Gammaproteobacteria bacterium]